jgi:hypothetical protein
MTEWIIEGVIKCPAACGLYLDFHGTPDELQQFTAAHDCAKTAAQARYED